MEFDLKHRRRWLIGGVLLALPRHPALHCSALATLSLTRPATRAWSPSSPRFETQYNMLKNNITHFSLKQQWQTTLTALKNANVANMFGETAGIGIALNTNSPSASVTGWKAATVSVNSNASSYLAGQALGNDRMSQLAMIEMSDAISPDCMTAIGQYRAARGQNATANSALASQELDSSDSTNTEIEQLNLLNAAEAQKMSEMQSQGTLQTCLASQMTVANMQQRNAAAQDLNTAAFVQQQRASNNVSATNEGSTWQNYIP